MDRRSFVRSAGMAAGGAAAGTLATPAIAQNMRELNMVTSWPRDFAGLGTTAQRIADSITSASDGQLSVKLFAGSELVQPLAAFDAVSAGDADLYHSTEHYWQSKDASFNFFSGVPMGLTANEMNSWIYFGQGQMLWDELSYEYNIKPMLAGNTGVQMGGWFNRKIESVDDLAGLKIRMPGLGGEVLRNLGANAVQLPGNEIHMAMQTGAIDAAEWFGPWNDLVFELYRVAEYYYYPGFHEPGTALSCGVNLDVWNSLTDAEQAIISNVCMAANSACLAEFNWRNGLALNELVYEHEVELRRFPDSVFDAIGKTAEDVVRNTTSRAPIARRIYDNFLTARGGGSGWGKISDRTYLEGRDRVLRLMS